jgi:hypothetical protein
MNIRAVLAIGLVLLFSQSRIYSQGAAPAVAVLQSAQGPVRLQSGALTRDLTKADAGRVLHGGDVLTCLTAAASFTLLNGALEEVPVKQCTKGYVLPAAAGNYGLLLDRYGRTGGRSRGTLPGLLFWPESGVRALPATAARMQWRRQPAGTATATLRDTAAGRVLWTRSDIDATAGSLVDPDLEAALRAAVAGGNGNPILEFRVSDTLDASVAISLIEPASERKLRQDLAAAEAGLGEDARHLVRADLFLQANLPREALDEYLSLLEAAPESALLLAKASALAVEISDPRAPDLVKRARTAAGT